MFYPQMLRVHGCMDLLHVAVYINVCTHTVYVYVASRLVYLIPSSVADITTL